MLYQWGGFAINVQVVAVAVFTVFLVVTKHNGRVRPGPYRLRKGKLRNR